MKLVTSLKPKYNARNSSKQCPNFSLSSTTMATIKTLYRLRALGDVSIPDTVTAAGNGDINEWVKHRFEANHPGGYVCNPWDVFTIIRDWIKQPHTEAQLRMFLSTTGNIPEDYLVSGKFSKNGVVDDSRLQLMREIMEDLNPPFAKAVPVNELDAAFPEAPHDGEIGANATVLNRRAIRTAKRQDKNGGVMLLDVEPITIKEHRRIHKKHYNQFAVCVLASVKMKFGVPKKTAANYLAIQRYAGELVKQRGVRPTDAVKIIPYVVSAAFIPTTDDLQAARWLDTELAKERLGEFKFMPTN